MIKAKRDADCMEGHDVRRRNDTKNSPKGRLCEADREGLNASTVLGNMRGAQKTAHEAA